MNWRVVLYCLLGGLPLTFAALGAGHFAWWWLSGILMAASFVPLALFGPRTAVGQFAVSAPVLLIVTVLCTWSEAVLFFPQLREQETRNLFSSSVMYLILGGILAVNLLPNGLRRSSNHPVGMLPVVLVPSPAVIAVIRFAAM